MIHPEPHPAAGETLKVNASIPGQGPAVEEFRLEDWWDRVAGVPWGDANGNPAAMAYAMRAGLAGLPWDNEVVYGKTRDGHGHIVHTTELVPA